MSRTSRYQQERIHHTKITVVFLAFFFILLAGIILIDIKSSQIISGDQKPGIVNVTDTGNNIYSLEILGCKIDFDLKYVKRDLDRFNESE